jgi:hypothetical protein
MWRNSAAVVRSGGRFYKGGLGNGSADLVGLLQIRFRAMIGELPAPITLGLFVALEVKMPSEKPTPDQAGWLACVQDAGGFACVVHSVEEAVAAIARARAGAAS